MKKFAIFALVGVAALGACDDVAPIAGPDGAKFELVDPDARVDAGDVNAWVYGSFILRIGGEGGDSQPILVENGESNFPGNPKNAGKCWDGTWYNPKGQATGGNRETPHPHCISGYTESGDVVEVILEPISANLVTSPQTRIRLSKGSGDNGRIQINTSSKLEAAGIIDAYAVRADDHTVRVGVIRIDLGQYSEQSSDALIDCNVDAVFGDDPTGCVKHLIDFTFTPDGEDPIEYVKEGFLWWVAGKTGPFDYDS